MGMSGCILSGAAALIEKSEHLVHTPSAMAVKRMDSLNMDRLFKRFVSLRFLAVASFAILFPLWSRAQNTSIILPISTTTEILLSGADWRLGSFAMDKGVEHQVYRPEFDDRSFSTVNVPGEVQLQIVLKGRRREELC